MSSRKNQALKLKAKRAARERAEWAFGQAIRHPEPLMSDEVAQISREVSDPDARQYGGRRIHRVAQGKVTEHGQRVARGKTIQSVHW